MALRIFDLMCIQMTDVLARITCIALVVCQGAMLDYYLIYYNNAKWYAWVVTDLFAVAAMISSMVISYFYLRSKRKTPDMQVELPISFICWIVYATVLVVRVAVIFKHVAHELEHGELFGPNMLRTVLAVTGVIFLLFVVCHHDAEPNTLRQAYITYLSTSVVMDIFDSITFLDILFTLENRVILPFNMEKTIIAFGCMVFFLPSATLYQLSSSHFGRKTVLPRVKTIHTLLYLILVNAPYTALRILLWHVYYRDISVFLIKNILMIYVALRTIWQNHLEIATIDGVADDTEMDVMTPARTGRRRNDINGTAI